MKRIILESFGYIFMAFGAPALLCCPFIWALDPMDPEIKISFKMWIGFTILSIIGIWFSPLFLFGLWLYDRGI